jgi:hypothetical protein
MKNVSEIPLPANKPDMVAYSIIQATLEAICWPIPWKHPNRQPLPLRQCLKLSLIGPIKKGSQNQTPGIVWTPAYYQAQTKIVINRLNYDKTKEVTQDPDNNPTLFLHHFMEAITKYTNLNPASQEDHIFLHLPLIRQSAPDIWEKLQKLEKSLLTPQQILISIAFQVFNNRDEEAKQVKIKIPNPSPNPPKSDIPYQPKNPSQRNKPTASWSLLPMWRPRALDKILP